MAVAGTAPSVGVALRNLRIIVGGLLAGVVAFGLVAAFLVRTQPRPPAPALDPLRYALAAVVLTALLAERLLRRVHAARLRRTWRAAPPPDPLAAAILPFTQLTLTAAALAEGATLFALVVYYLTADPIVLAIAAGTLVLLLSRWPSEARLRRLAREAGRAG